MIWIDKKGLEELHFGTFKGDNIAIIESRVETDGSTTLDIVFLGGQNKGQSTRIDQDESYNDLTVDDDLDDAEFNDKLISLLKEGIFSLSNCKSYKVETYRVVETIINQDFWVIADSEDEAMDIVHKPGFSELEDPFVHAGDERHDPFSATTLDFNISNIEEE